MLLEFALEPSLLGSWSDFRFFVSQFGFDRGRLIARFPKRWKRLVYDSLTSCKPVERARIEEALRRIDDRLVPRTSSTWNDVNPWLENAEAEHLQRPFRAIISASNPRRHPSVISALDLDDTIDVTAIQADDPRRLWLATRSKIVDRNAKEMADAIESFLQLATEIHFIDKHFGPENPRHRIPFQEFMARLLERPTKRLPAKVEVHCAEKSSSDFFASECSIRLAPLIPKGLSVKLRRWHPNDMHNRFVLTEHGGVAFLEGLDQFMGIGRSQDVVVLLDQEVSRQLMSNYRPEESPFRMIDEFEVDGTNG